MSISTHCNAGCNQAFTIEDFSHDQLPGGIEKTCFTCPHCGHEYVAYHTDGEIRSLQEKIRKVQRRFASPNYNHEAAAKQEAKIKKQIKQKMDALRERMEQHEDN